MEILAYLDPGSASALLAAILAGIAGIGAAIRTYGTNFLSKLMFWKKEGNETPADSVAGSDSTEDGPVEPK